jgi:serine/threonine-protein kinase
VLEGRIAPPSQYLADLPPGTDEVVMRGVTRNPAERYQTAREMAVAIERTMGLASPAMVGEWVESVAHEELDARARHIAFMENATIGHSADSVARLLAVPQASPSGSSMPGVREPSSLSSISVSSGPPSGRRRMPRLALAAIVASVALCVVGSGLVIATQGGTQGGPSAALGNASSPVAANPVARELEIIDRGAVALLAPSAAKPAGLPVTVGFNPTSRPAPRPRGTDCSPPYTIDPATGHKKYKKNCD